MTRPDGIAKVTGRAKFTSDLKLPGMVVGRVLTSTLAHAEIASIDVSAARAIAGVLAVITADDLQGVDPYFRAIVKDQPALAIGKVRHVGEPIAAVAAVDVSTAEAALRAIRVEYRELPVLDNLAAAAAADAALIHETRPTAPGVNPIPDTNVAHAFTEERGNVEAGFAQADVIIEDDFTFPRVYHYPMEAPAVVAQAEPNSITVYTVTQNPWGIQTLLAAAFGLPKSQVHVMTSYVGSGFGSRGKPLDIVAVALSRAAGVPVKLALSVSDDMLMTCRGGVRGHIRTGACRDGTIVAMEASYDYDCGAYTRRSPWTMELVASRMLSGYRIPCYRIRGRCINTTTIPASSYRAPGMQMVWARESHLDRLARELGIDAVEFRRRNFLRPGEEGAQAGLLPVDADLPSDIEKLASSFGWDRPLAPGHGKGVAFHASAVAASPPASAVVRLHSDGSLTVIAGGIEMGQGIYSAMTHVAALELGIPIENVHVVPTADTWVTPFDGGSAGSRSTVLTGLAVQMAVRDVKEQILDLASRMFECPPETLRIENGLVVGGNQQLPISAIVQWFYTPHKGSPHAGSASGADSAIGRVAHSSATGDLLGRAAIGPDSVEGRLDRRPIFWETAMGAAEVEVDRETGLVRLIRYTALADVGKVLADPGAARGQVQGSVVQGLGHTLSEQMLFQDGQPLNGSLMDYRVPKASDLPDRCECIFIENGEGPGPFGAKGMGQASIVPIAPAVNGAIASATGAMLYDLPMHPERVWRALQQSSTVGDTSAARDRREVR